MLTKSQIQQIDCFFEKSGLEYYDLRRELVDHVSELIEKKMKECTGLSFELAYKQEIKKFNKKELAEQNLSASQNYSPLKEWKYFNWHSVIRILTIYLFLKSSQLFYVEILYSITGMIMWIILCISFSIEHKSPKKKLSLYQPYSFFELIYPTVLFAYFLFRCISNPGQLMAAPSIARFEIVTFIVLFCISALLASQNSKKQAYNNAKNLYPFFLRLINAYRRSNTISLYVLYKTLCTLLRSAGRISRSPGSFY